jgi:putative endonuclease
LTRRAAGLHWESHALDHLRKQGLVPVARNFQSRFGEIDLVMRDGAALVFVEVRYRGPGARVRAAETISAGKRRHIVRTAEFFLLRNPQWRNAIMRFDVVAIDAAGNDPATLRWHRDAFRGA